ncbi:MAG: SLC13 family permease [Thermofilaceae archaeon]
MVKEWIKWLFGPAFLLALALAPPLPLVEEAARLTGVSLTKAPQIALGGLVWVASWWITEVAPLGLTGLLAAALFSILGFVSWNSALTSFTNPIIWIFIGGFVLAKAFSKWGVDKRAAAAVARLYTGRKPSLAAFFVACLPTFLLTVTGSITASASVVYPIALSYLTSIRASDSFVEATMLALGEASTAGAMLLLISTPPNLIAKQVLESALPGFKLTFFDWFIVGTPQAFLGLFTTWLIVFKLLKVEEKEVAAPNIAVESRASKEEKLVVAVFLAVLVLWMLPGALAIAASAIPSLEPVSKTVSAYLPEAAPAVLAILALGLIRTEKGPLLTFKEIAEGVDWNVVFMFGGGLAMGLALDASGFSRWIALAISSLGALDAFSLSVIGALLGFLITFPASNTAAAMISVPLIASLARGAGINPVGPILSTALACSISSALPSTTPPMAIIYGSGKVRVSSMFKVGIVSDLLRLALLIATQPVLVNYLLTIKGLKP